MLSLLLFQMQGPFLSNVLFLLSKYISVYSVGAYLKKKISSLPFETFIGKIFTCKLRQALHPHHIFPTCSLKWIHKRLFMALYSQMWPLIKILATRLFLRVEHLLLCIYCHCRWSPFCIQMCYIPPNPIFLAYSFPPVALLSSSIQLWWPRTLCPWT